MATAQFNKLRVHFFTTALLLFLSITSCKKDSAKPEDEKPELPDFGTCVPVAPAGRLTMNGTHHFTYTTSGGGTIDFDLEGIIKITHKDYTNFKLELWGGIAEDDNPITSANHENLNGKHIKDRVGKNRSVLFPDGAKITITSTGDDLPLVSVSIYDGNQSHHFNIICGTLEYSSTSSLIVGELDHREADGETSAFEFTSTGLRLWNIYNEEAPNDRVDDRQLLGELFLDDPNRVVDYYDDLRFEHT